MKRVIISSDGGDFRVTTEGLNTVWELIGMLKGAALEAERQFLNAPKIHDEELATPCKGDAK